MSSEASASATPGAPGRHNTCPQCGTVKHLEQRNYSMMWGEAELWCTACDVKIRDMDFG